ncbi:MAG: hypothetical protein KGS72_07145 [Cyanobacteria bacterium REEB67]|nr:hypothetical protein [Cyanobacteria bacterium REEB67]
MAQGNSKEIALAKALDFKVVDDSARVEICVKGEVLGFPATLEAIRPFFPFGCNYYIDIDVLKENNVDPSEMTLVITPKVAKGMMNFFSRLLLVDARTRPVGDAQFDRLFNVDTNDFVGALRFVRYPGMLEKIQDLQQFSGFSELHVRAKAGLMMVQPTCFNSLALDVAKESFRLLGEIGQILFDTFK